ncbi:MAG TPA: TonB family protein [Blastocatellia bacterium]|nr:TonB family protein [Blastocatellia bacterium]
MKLSFAAVSARFAALLLLVPTMVHAQTGSSQRTKQPVDVWDHADSIVTLSGEDRHGRPIAIGRGFFTGSHLIATDYEVIKDAVTIRAATADGVEEDVRVVGVDERFAAALLSTQSITRPPLPPAEGEPLAAGEEVFLSSGGSAFEQCTIEDVSDPVSSNRGKRYFKLRRQMVRDQRGGPVFNKSRQVVGLVVAPPDQPNDAGFGFVLPVSYLGSLGYAVPVSRPATSPETAVGPSEKLAGTADEIPADPEVIRRSDGEPKAIRKASPQYPLLAKAARVVGVVVVEVTIDEEGRVFAARTRSGHPLLKNAAENAARGWLFSPRTLGGRPVKVIGTLSINFTLDDSTRSATPPTPDATPSAPGAARETTPPARASAVDSKPVLLNNPRPIYTREARRNEIEGVVRLRVLVGSDGSVVMVRLDEGLPDGLNEQAIRAAHMMKFKPAMKDGKPVAYWLRVDVAFNLRR